MKIQYGNPKIIRFDLNKETIKNRIPLDFTKINIRYEYGIENVPEKHIWIGLRISAHITELKSSKEFLGYIFEFRAIALPENIENDLNDIIIFVKNALINFQLYFENNAPKEISKFQLFNKPNEIEYAKNLFEMIVNDGKVYS